MPLTPNAWISRRVAVPSTVASRITVPVAGVGSVPVFLVTVKRSPKKELLATPRPPAVFNGAVVVLVASVVEVNAPVSEERPVTVGEVAKTLTPVPVLSVRADPRFAEDGVARNVATPVPRPETPELMGNPVQFVNTPEVGVPNNGVTRVGDVAKTLTPVPVLSVKAEPKLVDDGVARNVATPAANPLTPDEIGRPVQFVKTPDVGVPRSGVTSVGEVARTLFPDPVLVTLTAFFELSSANAVEAVNPLSFKVFDASPIVDSNPVLGLKLNCVDDTLSGKFPVFAVTHNGYIVAFVVLSSTIVEVAEVLLRIVSVPALSKMASLVTVATSFAYSLRPFAAGFAGVAISENNASYAPIFNSADIPPFPERERESVKAAT